MLIKKGRGLPSGTLINILQYLSVCTKLPSYSNTELIYFNISNISLFHYYAYTMLVDQARNSAVASATCFIAVNVLPDVTD